MTAVNLVLPTGPKQSLIRGPRSDLVIHDYMSILWGTPIYINHLDDTSTSLLQLMAAMSLYSVQARGPSSARYAEALAEECATHWK